MEAISEARNRTGVATSEREVAQMLQAVSDLSPPIPISTLKIEEERLTYIVSAATVGSIPAAVLQEGSTEDGVGGGESVEPIDVLLDKLGERIAFERTGTRLYDALILKYLGLSGAEEEKEELLPSADAIARVSPGPPASSVASDQTVVETLRRIRAEELGDFQMLCDLVSQLGGDPTAQTPCADVTAAASMGLMQAMTDPRTTLAQCLNTILTAELTDNAGWELLGELAAQSNQAELTEPFAEALEAERAHLAIIRGWLRWLVLNETRTSAV